MPSSIPAALDLTARTFRSKPLLFVAAAWIAGIGLADHWTVPPIIAGVLGLTLGLAAPIVRNRVAALALLLLGVTGLGLSATRQALTPPQEDISELAGRQLQIRGVIDSEPTRGCDRWRFLLRCTSVRSGAETFPTRGRLAVSTPDDMSHHAPGDRVRVYGVPERPSRARNPGGFSAECWLARQGVFSTLSARPGSVIFCHQVECDWRRSAGRARHWIADSNRQVMNDPEAASLVNSILFGDPGQEDARLWGATEERFRQAGVYHELVVSGAQVALLFGLLVLWRRWVLRARTARKPWLLLRRTGQFSPRLALGTGLGFVAVYVLLIGPQPSVLRAAALSAFFFTARCVDREIDAENMLAAAAILLLVINPLTLYDIGFQFSFVAVWGILRGSPPLARALSPSLKLRSTESAEAIGIGTSVAHQPGWFAWICAASLAAQLATVPLQGHHFQTLAVVGPLSNAPVEILVSVLLPLGLATSVLTAVMSSSHLLSIATLHYLNWPTQALAWGINWTVRLFAWPPCATVSVFPPGWAEVGLYWTSLFAATCPSVVGRRQISLALVALGVTVLATSLLWPSHGVSEPTFTFIDVGQGDACLVRLPGGATMLVDGGGSPRAPCETRDCADAPVGRLAASIRTDCTDVGRDILASYLRHERVRRIDLLVVTHPHDDHLWGLDAVLDPQQHIEVGAVLDAGMTFASPANREWAWLLRLTGTKVIRARRGMQLSLGPGRLEVLHPSDAFLHKMLTDPNKNSIVLRLDVGGSRVLLTGDAEAEAEAAMGNEDVRADVLKVGHHGSAYSTSDAWLDRVQPRIAVISCGRHNSFGHPSPDTLARLRRHGVRTYRTDLDGAVILELQPNGWTATPMLHPQPPP